MRLKRDSCAIELSTGAGGIEVRGTTRSFALGAVIQHFPKTLARNADPQVARVDFRLPTEEELDAMEAFMNSLTTEGNLDVMLAGAVFRGADAEQLYQANCDRSHDDNTANSGGNNKGEHKIGDDQAKKDRRILIAAVNATMAGSML